MSIGFQFAITRKIFSFVCCAVPHFIIYCSLAVLIHELKDSSELQNMEKCPGVGNNKHTFI